jgi:hypothetical protein
MVYTKLCLRKSSEKKDDGANHPKKWFLPLSLLIFSPSRLMASDFWVAGA